MNDGQSRRWSCLSFGQVTLYQEQSLELARRPAQAGSIPVVVKNSSSINASSRRSSILPDGTKMMTMMMMTIERLTVMGLIWSYGYGIDMCGFGEAVI